MIFTKQSTRLFIILLTCLLVGFILMISDNSIGEEATADLFGFRTITLAPLMVVVSYIGFFIFILKNDVDVRTKK